MTIQKLFVPAGLSNHPGRSMEKIKYITIHETGNFNSSADAHAHARFQFNGGGGRQVSWHYTVDDREVWQSFKDRQMCWHTGSQRGNSCSIGIEICVNNKSGFLAACVNTAKLTAELIRDHGLQPEFVVQHNFWNGKNCPRQIRGNLWGLDWAGFMELVQEHLQTSVPTVTEKREMTAVGRKTIIGLEAAGINFDKKHWELVFKGLTPPNPKWTKTVLNRIVDARGPSIEAEDIEKGFLALLGKLE